MFPNEEACDAYLVARRWPDGVHCPRCGSNRPYELKTMKFKWECPDCSDSGYRFSNIAGTIFENTNVDLRRWFQVIHLLLTGQKEAVERAADIRRRLGFGSYKTALVRLCRRVRAALAREKGVDKLGGVVEVDAIVHRREGKEQAYREEDAAAPDAAALARARCRLLARSAARATSWHA